MYCIGVSLLLVSCSGSSSSTTSTLTDAELNIFSGIVSAPSSVLSGSSNNIIMLAEGVNADSAVSTSEVPMAGASVCARSAITSDVFTKSDFVTPLCTTAGTDGSYILDMSHLSAASLSIVTLVATSADGAVEVSGVIDTTADSSGTFNLGAESTKEALLFESAHTKLNAENIGVMDALTDLATITELFSSLLEDINSDTNLDTQSLQNRHFIRTTGGTAIDRERERELIANDFEQGIEGYIPDYFSSREAELTAAMDALYSAATVNTGEMYSFGCVGSDTHCGDDYGYSNTYVPDNVGVAADYGHGAGIDADFRPAEGSTFVYGVDISDMAAKCTNCNYGKVSGFVYDTHVDGRIQIQEEFQNEYYGTELAGKNDKVYFIEVFDIPDSYMAGYDGGCLNEETFSRTMAYVDELVTEDLTHLDEHLCDGTYIEGDRFANDVNYESWDHFSSNYKGYAGDCSDHIDEYGNIKEYAPEHCYEQFGASTWDDSEHVGIDPFIDCYDENENGDITIRTDSVDSAVKTECDNFIQGFKGFTGSTTGIPDPTVEIHVDYFCDAYFMIDSNGNGLYGYGAPPECSRSYGVASVDIDPDSICRNHDGSFKLESEITDPYHQDMCRAYQYDKEQDYAAYYASTNPGGVVTTYDNWEDFDKQDECSEESCENNVVYGDSCIKYSAMNTPPCCYEKFPLEGTVAFPICEGYDNYIPDPIAACYRGAISNGATLDTTNEDCYGFPKTIDTSNSISLAAVCHSYYNYDDGQTFNANTPSSCTESIRTLIKCGEADSGTLAAGCYTTEVTCYKSIDVNWDSGNLEIDELDTTVTQAICESAFGATFDSVDLYMPESTSN